MSFLQFLLIAILQGLLEWLPISSEGQITLVMLYLFNITELSTILSLIIWLHLGTAGAALLKYRSEYFNVIFSKTAEFSYLRRFLIIATLATGVTAIPLYLLLHELFKLIYGDIISALIGVFLIVTGIVLYFFRNIREYRPATDLTLREIILLGLIQGFSILPGISRSGTTVATLLGRKIEQENCLKYSFLMSVPVILAAFIFDLLISGIPEVAGISFYVLMLMIGVAFVFGLLSMNVLLIIAKKVNFAYFCVIIGLIAVVLGLLPHI
ncbi:MAG: undecaprenyl-diphosphate phosphatase [Promethearchaeota archaeon]